jgi:uncharacterized protein YndB with AHSA1/START domain
MLSTTKNLEIRCHIPAKPENVFEAWTRPELMNWYCPEDMKVISAEADVRVHGNYRVSMRAGNGQVYTFDGVYEEIVPNRKLVFTHRWEEAEPLETHVTVEFAAAKGGTELTIQQDGIATEALAKGHEARWTSTLRNLAKQFGQDRAEAPRKPRPSRASSRVAAKSGHREPRGRRA